MYNLSFKLYHPYRKNKGAALPKQAQARAASLQCRLDCRHYQVELATSELRFFCESSCLYGNEENIFAAVQQSDIPGVDPETVVCGQRQQNRPAVPQVVLACHGDRCVVIPFASFASVLPVHGATTMMSNKAFGPMGSRFGYRFYDFPACHSLHHHLPLVSAAEPGVIFVHRI